MLTFPYGRTVVIVRPGAPGFGGDPGTPEADRPVDGCVVFPGDTTEVTDHADRVIADLTVVFPVGTDVLATDQVRDPDDPATPARLCVIIGSPERYSSPFTGLDPGVVVRLQRETG